MEKGAAALSDAELLAILIGSGNTEESAFILCSFLRFPSSNAAITVMLFAGPIPLKRE